jgi:dynein heavy chain, axonemal
MKKKIARADWVLEWPGQVVIAGCQTNWTSAVSKAIEKNQLKEYHKKQLEELDDLRELVRGDLTTKARQTLSALIVIEVHARDVVINLIEEKVSDINDFDWISQLR